jgi:hypothetical protein
VDDTQIDLPLTAFIPADWIPENEEKMAAYRAAADCVSKEALVELAAGWTDRYGAIPAAVQSLLQLLELKLLARRCGFSRIKPEKPNIALETPMEEPAFRLLRQGLPQHLHGRLVYQGATGSTAKVLARGLGVLPIERQVEELMGWLATMAAQLPDAEGLSEAERERQETERNEAVLRVWADYLAANTKPGDRFEISERRGERKPVMRRLTNTQYNNTVRDLLGDDTRVADQFPPEDFVNGFRNQFQSQSVSPMLAESYAAGAEKLAKSAFRGGDTRGLVPCKDTTPACGAKFIREFGRKAFRRPLLETEVTRYGKLWAAGGAPMVVEGMLQSPNFLLRTENGAEPSWRPYETASRLSYALWNSMPDTELFRAAGAG